MPLFSARRASSLVAEAEANRELVDSEQRVARIRAQAMLYELHQHMTQATLVARTLKDDIQPRSAEALKETEYSSENPHEIQDAAIACYVASCPCCLWSLGGFRHVGLPIVRSGNCQA
jgi:hypothetical protein